MRNANTSLRLKQLMSERNLRQVDILNAARPYCAQYGVKLEKNDLSQYVNGKVEPGQEKLTILGLALNVNETWLMGYDVSPLRTNNDSANEDSNSSSSIDMSDVDIAFYGGYKELSEDDQKTIRDMVQIMRERRAHREAE